MIPRKALSQVTVALLSLPLCAMADNPEADESALEAWRVSDAAIAAMERDWPGVANPKSVEYPRRQEDMRPTEDIQVALRKEAASWVGKVLKEGYVPPDLLNQFVGCRRTVKSKHMTREVDYLFARFRRPKVMIHVCEQKLGLCVMVKPQDAVETRAPTTWQEAHQHLLNVFSAFFRQPDIALDHSQIGLLRRNGAQGQPLFFGKMRLAPYPGIPGADPFKQKRYWYDDMSVLVDGNTVAFFFRKLDGTSEGASAPVAGKRW